MPFESEAQRRFMYAKHPKIAAKWTAEAKEEGKPNLAAEVLKMWRGGELDPHDAGQDIDDEQVPVLQKPPKGYANGGEVEEPIHIEIPKRGAPPDGPLGTKREAELPPPSPLGEALNKRRRNDFSKYRG